MKKKELLDKTPEVVEESPVQDSNDSSNLPEPVVVQPLTLTLPTSDIVEKVKEATTKEELQELEEVFSVAMTKNEIARMAKQDELLDLIIAQADERIRKRPGELPTKDLLDYMNVLQNNIDRSHKNIKSPTEDGPVSQINNIRNEVTVNMTGDGLTRDSQNKVMDVVKAILQQAQEVEITEPEIIESVEPEEISEEKGVNEDD